MKLCEVSRKLKKMFEEKGGERFFTASSFVSAVLEKNGIGRNERLVSPEKEIKFSEKIFFDAEILLSGYPIQYYLGSEFFCGHEFAVSEGVLIPRGDTEILVREGIKNIEKGVFFDLCSGTGCVGISVLKERPELSCISIDISEKAIELTEKNAETLGVKNRVKTYLMDIFSDSIFDIIEKERPEYVLSNPPYIRTEVMKELPTNVGYEPSIALDGGKDGMMFYRRILSVVKKMKIPFSVEIGFDQREEMKNECLKVGAYPHFFKDLNGNDRVCSAKWENY